MLVKVFPLKLKPGAQAQAERIVLQYAELGPKKELGTLSFRVYRDPAKIDYLLFVEHFTDQQAYEAHTGSDVYREVVQASLAPLLDGWSEINHELIVSKS
jgi:quinol monooxygenase YgiN